ncbi:Orotate phosphoribosyltransferase, partial [Clarias magur]
LHGGGGGDGGVMVGSQLSRASRYTTLDSVLSYVNRQVTPSVKTGLRQTCKEQKTQRRADHEAKLRPVSALSIPPPASPIS